MATGASVARCNAAVDADNGVGTWIQLHVGAPGAAGTTNVAGNTTRQQATMGSAAGGQAATTAPLNWTAVSTTEHYTFFSQWSLATGGTLVRTGTLTANAVTAGDNFTIPTGSLVVGNTPAS